MRVPFERDLAHWGPIWAGFFVSLGVLLLLTPIGIAIGLTDAGWAAVWGVISLIIAFFCGGWVAGRTLSFSDGLVAGAHGLTTWALVITLLFLTTILLSAIGAAGAATALPGGLAVPTVVVPTETAAGAAWGTFLALLLSAGAGVIGAIVGNGSVTERRQYYR